MLHYHEMYFDNPKTGYCTIIGTYKPFPTHAHMPTISEDDHTIMATVNTLEIFKKIVPVSAIEKRNHCKFLISITNVFYRAPKANAKQVDPQTKGQHTALKDGPSIISEGGYNTNFEGWRDADHFCWPYGTRSHPHNPAYTLKTNEEHYTATINVKPATHDKWANTSSHDGHTNSPTRS